VELLPYASQACNFNFSGGVASSLYIVPPASAAFQPPDAPDWTHRHRWPSLVHLRVARLTTGGITKPEPQFGYHVWKPGSRARRCPACSNSTKSPGSTLLARSRTARPQVVCAARLTVSLASGFRHSPRAIPSCADPCRLFDDVDRSARSGGRRVADSPDTRRTDPIRRAAEIDRAANPAPGSCRPHHRGRRKVVGAPVD
jgi:hypothetical protein